LGALERWTMGAIFSNYPNDNPLCKMWRSAKTQTLLCARRFASDFLGIQSPKLSQAI
jgi:hypothetical protein